MKNETKIERKSEREIVTTRIIRGPAHLVFEAWTTPDLFAQWWLPKSCPLTIVSCEMDVRVGGKYRLVIRHEGGEMPFFGVYREVVPNARLVWTNEESEDGAVTTATFEETNGQTLVVVSDLYPSKRALDEAITSGANCLPETLDQLEALLAQRT